MHFLLRFEKSTSGRPTYVPLAKHTRGENIAAKIAAKSCNVAPYLNYDGNDYTMRVVIFDDTPHVTHIAKDYNAHSNLGHNSGIISTRKKKFGQREANFQSQMKQMRFIRNREFGPSQLKCVCLVPCQVNLFTPSAIHVDGC